MWKSTLFALGMCLCVPAGPGFAASPVHARLVKDIDTAVSEFRGDFDGQFVRLGNAVYFAAGHGLWRTFPAARAGTHLVWSGLVEDLVQFQGRLYFSSTAHPFLTLPLPRAQLWSSDGTGRGTQLVAAIGPISAQNGDITSLTAAGNRLYFVHELDSMYNLYMSDGTEPGTVPLFPGTGYNWKPYHLTAVGNTLYFAMFRPDLVAGAELWKFEPGVTPQPVMVKDIAPGIASSNPEQLTALGGLLYFSAEAPDTGRELWRSDGTEAGTVMVTDLAPGAASSDPSSLTPFDGGLLFAATTPSTGNELWFSDGSEAGTHLVADIEPGGDSSNPHDLLADGGTVYFAAYRDGYGVELWRSDGTSAGTQMVRDIAPGGGDSDPRPLGVHAGIVYLAASQPDTGSELWRSDGTAAGTTLVADLNAGPEDSSPMAFADLFGKFLFTANGTSDGREPWASDGTAAGTRELANTDTGAESSRPGELVRAAGKVFFEAHTPGSGWELWVSDGTGAGTALTRDIRPGSASSFPSDLVPFEDGVLFAADDGSSGNELWFSDGTEAGTRRVSDILPGVGSSNPGSLTPLGGAVYFSALAAPGGAATLWRTDGTTAGTAQVVPGDYPADPGHFVTLNGSLYFSGTDPDHGSELWQSDGTAGGTSVFLDLAPGPQSSFHDNGVAQDMLAAVGGRLYFTTSIAGDPSALWVSDGTPAGTTKVFDFPAGTSVFEQLHGVGEVLFFKADYTSLWRTDGTAGGTFEVKSDIFPPGATVDCSSEFTDIDGLLVFAGWSDATGCEPYRSDGYTAQVIADIFPGPASSLWPPDAGQMRRVGNVVLFGADDGTWGSEVWATDGTRVLRLTDLAGCGGWSQPREFTRLGNQVLFAADDLVVGRELFAIDRLTALPEPAPAHRNEAEPDQSRFLPWGCRGLPLGR